VLEAIVSAAKLLPSVIQGASRLIIRPRLVLSVGQDAPWSVQTATTRPPIVNPIDWVNDGVMHYFRVQVKNRGKRTASGCHVTLCERSATDERKYYVLHLPDTTALVDLVALARSRWPIEQQYRELKDDLGLDHFEGRTYRGWAHHVVLTAVAFTFLQIERGRATVAPRPTLPVVRGWVREIMGLLYVIHNRRLLSTLDSFRRNAPLRR
jgi:hypothetical protein